VIGPIPLVKTADDVTSLRLTCSSAGNIKELIIEKKSPRQNYYFHFSTGQDERSIIKHLHHSVLLYFNGGPTGPPNFLVQRHVECPRAQTLKRNKEYIKVEHLEPERPCWRGSGLPCFLL
jgi:hypothetical protein